MIKLNCDMGEGFGAWSMGADETIMPFIDMTNIACGFHAGDPQIMDRTVALAVEHNVMIGAHPGYPDLLGFGRKPISFSENEITNIVLYQVGALQGVCSRHRAEVNYIKPHGALYNVMMLDLNVFAAIVKAASTLKLPLMIMATPDNHKHIELAQSLGVSLLLEAFCDRAYTSEGHLQSRQEEGAVHQSLELIIHQARQIIEQQTVNTTSGKELPLKADSLCIHGDNHLALASVKELKKILSP